MSSKFSRVSATRDQSTYKTLLVGIGGAGKTFFVSTITAEDGRPMFLLAVEEGGKGVSPNHAPKHYDGVRPGTYALPESFDELIEAMRNFRDVINAHQPPPGWLERAGEYQPFLQTLVNAYPGALSANEVASGSKRNVQDVPTAMRALIEAQLVRQVEKQVPIKGQKQPQMVQAYVATVDHTWLRPHVHFAVDSTSGVERLIHQEVMKRDNVTAMADKEYSVLWNKALPLWEQFLAELDSIRATNVHVWVIAHATEITDAAQNDGRYYRRLDLQLRGNGKALDEARAVLRNWADNVYYLINHVDVKEGSKKARSRAKLVGRQLITQFTGICMAKTRPQVPPELPGTWEDLKRAWKAGVPAKTETILARMEPLIVQLRELDPQLADEVTAQRDAAAGSATRLGEVLSRLQGLVTVALEERQVLSGTSEEDDGADSEDAPGVDEPQRPPSNRPQATHPDNVPAGL
ncbi:hypothetical protein EKK58_05850 [Candidatus Dependentiae bacterium]|nr:MAG: hypothetical protein EKK58_05850 [Candidatus Dependentiae bacterium]